MKTLDQLFKGMIMFIILFMPLSYVQAQFRVIGYLPNWGNFVTAANNLDHTKLTHINISFINPTNTNGDLGPTTNLSTVVGILHSHNLKVIASIGGATGSAYYANLLSTSVSRTAFVNKLKQFTLDYNLDGIDVDLEGSATTSFYEPFVLELKDSMVAHNKITSAAVGTWFSSSISNNALAAFDFVNIMSYDRTGPWQQNTPGQHSSYADAIVDLNFWANRGLTPDKMCLGVPFYGYTFVLGSTSFTWSSVVNSNPESIYNDEIYPAAGKGKYYNGIITIQKKTKLALAQAGGIMIWEMTQDTRDANSLLTAIDNVIQDNGANTPPTTSITSPSNASTFAESSNISIAADAADVDGNIIKVEFYAGSFKIGEDYTAPYSIVWNSGGANAYDITSVAYDNLSSFTTSSPISIDITAIASPTVYGNTIWSIPGKIEVENFNWGDNNTSYYDNSLGNNGGNYRATDVDIEHCLDVNGGYSIAWTAAGEWLEYDVNISQSAMYTIESRVATTYSGRNFHIEIDGVNVSSAISTNSTSGWQTWSTITTNGIALSQGLRKMKLVVDNGNVNLNYINFSLSTNTATSTINNSSNNVSLFPNPCNNELTIEYQLTNPSSTQFSIVDQFERELISIEVPILNEGKHIQSINTNNLASGIYFCKIKTDSGLQTLKFIKQ